MKASRMFKQVITACSQHIDHKYDIIGDEHGMLAAHKSQKWQVWDDQGIFAYTLIMNME